MSKKTTDVSNFALAGFGRFGRHHANVIASYPSSRLLAIAEPNELALEKASKEFPETAIFKDPYRMMEEVEVDAISIVSPEDTHAELVKHALNKDIHVFCEKPLSTKLDEARD